MRLPPLGLAFCLALPLVLRGETAAPPISSPAAKALAAPAKKDSGKSEWVFSLLPKSLQKNPRLDLTVITEMTEAGKKLAPVSPAKPAYFEAFSAGFHQLGHAPGNEKTLTPPDIERLLT